MGQSEVEVMGQADTVLVLLAPGTGDAVQVAKAGIRRLPISSWSTRPTGTACNNTTRELRSMISIGDRGGPDAWVPEIVTTVATRAEGIEALVSTVWSVTGRGLRGPEICTVAAWNASGARSRRSPWIGCVTSSPAPGPWRSVCSTANWTHTAAQSLLD